MIWFTVVEMTKDHSLALPFWGMQLKIMTQVDSWEKIWRTAVWILKTSTFFPRPIVDYSNYTFSKHSSEIINMYFTNLRCILQIYTARNVPFYFFLKNCENVLSPAPYPSSNLNISMCYKNFTALKFTTEWSLV